jgi:hypothetical protein
LNAWRDAWTSKNFQGKRELKEASKLPKQEAFANIFEEYQNILKER